MTTNTFSSNNPFARYTVQQLSEETAETLPEQQVNIETYSRSHTLLERNIASPPPAYFPRTNIQHDLEANSPPPYEPSRDRPAYTDNVPLQNLRPLNGLGSHPSPPPQTLQPFDGLSPHPTPTLEAATSSESPKDQETAKKGVTHVWVTFFAVGIVAAGLAIIPFILQAEKNRGY
ncbi:hypothetical protein V1517DRAFT_339105 [Lipomyces orientalis]|uniref:Uncharacterized protein n=1 Tax=Lipomyces orientalis TaxID=1233043 RepID=A0ACC3TMU2_9ASCO